MVMDSKLNIPVDRTLARKESLKSKKDIQELFIKSSSFYLYPFLIRYSDQDTSVYPKILVSVPKKKFKRAVHRNILKRRIREAYRLEKEVWHKSSFVPANVVIIFLGKEIVPFQYLKNKLSLALQRLVEEKQADK